MEEARMKASERRLLMIFLAVIAAFGGLLLSERLQAWDHRLDLREREAALLQTEASMLLAEEPQWLAKGAWLTATQPVAQSELEANENLLGSLLGAATSGGLQISKTQLEPVQNTSFYQQFGITLNAKGEVPALMRWIHTTLQPDAFYVMPLLRITPDKDDPPKVTAQVRFWRWYGPERTETPKPDQGS